MFLEITSVDNFTVRELVDLYIQNRVDYLIPMPMNAERLAEYINLFDIDLSTSGVTRAGDGQAPDFDYRARFDRAIASNLVFETVQY